MEVASKGDLSHLWLVDKTWQKMECHFVHFHARFSIKFVLDDILLIF